MSDLATDDILSLFRGAKELGRGGQKVVFSLEHEEHGAVVLKVGAYSSAEQLERIRREVEILGSLTSPYFPRQYHFGVHSGQRYSIVEERLAGKPLTSHLTDFNTVESAARFMLDLVRGLSELWSRRIVHRDVKPANIIVGLDGRPRIIDLGIAKLLDRSALTNSMAAWGPCTPAYAAPEQLLNKASAIGPRTDQFALGIVMGQILLVGSHPFDPDVAGTGSSIPENIVLGAWARERIAAASSTGCFTIIERLLSSQPHQRYRRPDELLMALEGLS